MQKVAKKLTTAGREHISEGNFALPGRRYPIHDLAHARNALARVAQHGTPAEQSAVKRAVYAKYPALKERSEERQESKEASQGETTMQFVLTKKAQAPVEEPTQISALAVLLGKTADAGIEAAAAARAKKSAKPEKEDDDKGEKEDDKGEKKASALALVKAAYYGEPDTRVNLSGKEMEGMVESFHADRARQPKKSLVSGALKGGVIGAAVGGLAGLAAGEGEGVTGGAGAAVGGVIGGLAGLALASGHNKGVERSKQVMALPKDERLDRIRAHAFQRMENSRTNRMVNEM